MSSSTANTTRATLRQSTDKKPGQDPTHSDGIDTSLKNDGSQSFKGNPYGSETVLERSKHVATTNLRKKSVAKRTHADVKKKAAWKTAVSVIVNNLCLLVILLPLAQMVRKLEFNYGGGVDFEVVGVEYVRQIAEVEKFLKITTRMLEEQVDVVDRKLESQVSGLRSEMDDESGKFNEMDMRVGGLEGVLNGKEWLTREEFDKFVEEFKSRKGGEIGLDEIRAIAKGVVEKEIAEVEKFLEIRTKKVESQVSGLRKRMDDGKFNKRFTEMDMRVGRLEGVLNGNEWLTGEEFDKFVEEFKRRKGGEIGLDEIRAIAKGVVEKEIARHAADGLGRVDYAVASGGASVVKHSEAYFGARGVSRVTEWLKGGSVRGDSVKVLQPSFGQPGECFSLKGESGFVEIKLRTAIFPEAITLEHVDKSVASDRLSAPKDCKVLGLLLNEDDTEKEHLLAEFTYDLEKSSAQTFNVIDSKSSDSTIIDTLRLEFMSNHGSPTHTCIYRVRVHGHQPNVDV